MDNFIFRMRKIHLLSVVCQWECYPSVNGSMLSLISLPSVMGTNKSVLTRTGLDTTKNKPKATTRQPDSAHELLPDLYAGRITGAFATAFQDKPLRPRSGDEAEPQLR